MRSTHPSIHPSISSFIHSFTPSYLYNKKITESVYHNVLCIYFQCVYVRSKSVQGGRIHFVREPRASNEHIVLCLPYLWSHCVVLLLAEHSRTALCVRFIIFHFLSDKRNASMLFVGYFICCNAVSYAWTDTSATVRPRLESLQLGTAAFRACHLTFWWRYL